jgi:subtilisin family serine protease
VEFVEQDAAVSLSEARIEPTAFQNGATWGLDRIDQAARPLDGQYRYRYSGAGVYAFIIDTGILAGHVDFGTRRLSGYSVFVDGYGDSDCNGHGTHVAGTVGGATWGVAKTVTLVPVRVLDCAGSGSWSGVIAGVDWVAGQTGMRPAVANMSLGGGKSTSVNAAVARAHDQGVTMVVAAGNSNANACNYSPASEPKAVTVGATTSTDARASYSNFGSCLDLFAPGSSITSAWYTSTADTKTISGTSMASPHAAGALALLASRNNPNNAADVANLYAQVRNAGNYDWFDDSGDGIKEPLLDVGTFVPFMVAGSGGGGGGGNTAPVVTITSPADGASFDSGTSISFAGTATDEGGDLAGQLKWTSSRDGPIGTGASFDAVLSDGSHTVTAEVTDSGGLTGSASITITVVAGGGGGGSSFTLDVNPYKVRGAQYADLTWSGATSTNVDVYRDGGMIVTTANDGAHTDVTGQKGGGSHSYQVCEAGTSTCSNTVTVSW